MKKLVSFFICMLIFLSMPLICSADTQHRITELGVSLYLPDDLHVITRNTPASSSVWNKFDYIPEEHLAWMSKNDLYITAASKSFDYEIIIGGAIGLSEEITSIDAMDEKEQSSFYMKLYDETPGIRMPGFKDQIVKIGSKTFFIYDVYTAFDSASEGRMYLTIHNRKAIAIALAPSSGLIDEDDIAILEGIASSLDFSSAKSNVTSSNYNSSKNDSDTSLTGIVVLVLLGLTLFAIIAGKISKNKAEENNFYDTNPKETSENLINIDQIKHDTKTAESTQVNVAFNNAKPEDKSDETNNKTSAVEASISNNEVEQEHSMIWFIYFTKIRPWIHIILHITSFSFYASSIISFGCFIAMVLLQINLFIKSKNKTPSLYSTIKTYIISYFWINAIHTIIFEVPQLSISNDYEVLGMFIGLLLAILFWYFVWYRLNISYFRKRLVPPEKPVITINLKHTYEDHSQKFCTQCGAQLKDGTKFCHNCGAKVI